MFYLSLGNNVFADIQNNGVRDPSVDTGIANVRLNLYADDGDGIFDDTLDPFVKAEFTDANGDYRFDELLAGNYFVDIDPSNFDTGGPLLASLQWSIPL